MVKTSFFSVLGRFHVFFSLEYAFKSVGSSRNVYFWCGMYFSNRTWFLTKVVGRAHTMRHVYFPKTNAFYGQNFIFQCFGQF